MAYEANLQLLTGATATNGAPTLSTDGVALKSTVDRATIVVKEDGSGSGVMTVTLKAWGYFAAIDAWAPLGVNATAANKGLLNDGNAIDETGTDLLTHAEELFGLLKVDRLYLEVTAIGGTATSIDAWALLAPRSAITAG